VFEVKKSRVFWVGFTISGLASLLLFLTIWIYLTTSRAPFLYRNMIYPLPLIVDCIVFFMIGLYMMKGDKTTVFWIGLFIFGFGLTVLFSTLWYSLVLLGDPSYLWNWALPFTLGSVVFILIGLYMMNQEHKGSI
jgi:hypothetical protein